MEPEPQLEAYARPANDIPPPDPPLVWREAFRPIARIDGMDDSDTPLHWWVSSTVPPPWDPNEVRQMWYQLMQIYRLPSTL